MTQINVVTAFNENSLKDHAHQMFQRVDKFWHPDIKLHAYHFDCALEAYDLPSCITYKNLEEVKEFNDFLSAMDVHNGTENGTIAYNWRVDALLTAPKVFALTEKAFEIAEKTKDGGWLVWLNTNIIPVANLTSDFIESFFPEGADIVISCAQRYADALIDIELSPVTDSGTARVARAKEIIHKELLDLMPQYRTVLFKDTVL